MVRIIQRGVLPDEEIEIGAMCRHCGTYFGFFPKEAERVHDQREGGFYRIPCPLCKKDVGLGTNIAKAVGMDDYNTHAIAKLRGIPLSPTHPEIRDLGEFVAERKGKE